MEQYFIGIDSGTTSIKAVLFDSEGNEIGKAARALHGIFPEEDQYEEDMEEIWDKCRECVREVAIRFPEKKVAGIGITAQGDGLWMVDDQISGVLTGPAIGCSI